MGEQRHSRLVFISFHRSYSIRLDVVLPVVSLRMSVERVDDAVVALNR